MKVKRNLGLGAAVGLAEADEEARTWGLWSTWSTWACEVPPPSPSSREGAPPSLLQAARSSRLRDRRQAMV